MLAMKIRRWKTRRLWVVFTHLWNCHMALLNLPGLNAGFPWKRQCGPRTLQPSKKRLMRVSFILVCVLIGLFVLSRKQFLLSVTPPTSLRMIPSPQKKSDVDVGQCLTFPTITPGTSKLVFCFMLCRGVYCAFSSNQLTSCQILILQPENHRLYSGMLFHAAPEKTFLLETKATSLCWTNYSSDKCERTIPPSHTHTYTRAHTGAHTRNSTAGLNSDNWLKVASLCLSTVLKPHDEKLLLRLVYGSDVKLPVA